MVGLYRQEASRLPRPRRCIPIGCPSGCLTSRGWDDMTLMGAGGMAGAETAQQLSLYCKIKPILPEHEGSMGNCHLEKTVN